MKGIGSLRGRLKFQLHQLLNLRVTDKEIERLNQRLAIAQTARIAYARAAAGLLIECQQHFVPGRSFCRRDQLANTVGIMLGLVV